MNETLSQRFETRLGSKSLGKWRYRKMLSFINPWSNILESFYRETLKNIAKYCNKTLKSIP